MCLPSFVGKIRSDIEIMLGVCETINTSSNLWPVPASITSASANPYLMRSHQGITEEYRRLNILNYEMECGTLFKMGSIYNFAAAGVCGVVAQRTVSEAVIVEQKDDAVQNAIAVAVRAAEHSGELG